MGSMDEGEMKAGKKKKLNVCYELKKTSAGILREGKTELYEALSFTDLYNSPWLRLLIPTYYSGLPQFLFSSSSFFLTYLP